MLTIAKEYMLRRKTHTTHQCEKYLHFFVTATSRLIPPLVHIPSAIVSRNKRHKLGSVGNDGNIFKKNVT